MTVVDMTWAPDHAPPAELPTRPVRLEALALRPTVQQPLTGCVPGALPPTRSRQVPPEERALALCESIVGKLGLLSDPVARYRAMAYWRGALERAAMEMTACGDTELVKLADGGLSAAKISQLLTDAKCPLSKSGVEQALKRSRAARPST